VVVHQQDNNSDASAEYCEFHGCIRILALTDLTPNYDRAHLGVVKCTLAQSNKSMTGEELSYFKHVQKIVKKVVKL